MTHTIATALIVNKTGAFLSNGAARRDASFPDAGIWLAVT